MSHPQQCPLCQQSIDADEAAFAFHVNRCLDQSAGSTIASTSVSTIHRDNSASSPACTVSLNGMQEKDKTAHVEACLAMQPAAPHPTSFKRTSRQPLLRLDTTSQLCPICQRELYASEDLDSHAQACATSRDSPPAQDDVSEDISLISSLLKSKRTSRSSSPPEGPEPATSWSEPGIASEDSLFPIMQALLGRSHASGHSVSSILCSPHTSHISVGFTDALYGCGYRCAQMLYASLRNLPVLASHLATSSHPGELSLLPSMKQLQHYIEAAWEQGYDPSGREHFEGRLLNRRKWIGTTELYVLFTYLGIPVRIIDFPKNSRPSGGAHVNMIRWVKRYFEQEEEDHSRPKSPEMPRKRMAAFDVLMSSKGEACRQGHRQPLFLQHQGHSRVIIGIEKGKSEADTTLLLFDPGLKTKPKVRKAAEAYAKQAQEANKRAKREEDAADDSDATEDSSADDADSEKSGSSVKRWLKSLKSDPSRLDLDDHAALLNVYRVSVKQLSKKSEYQILFVQDDAPPLSPQQRRARRIPASTTIT